MMHFHTSLTAVFVNLPFSKKTVFRLIICICVKDTPYRSCERISKWGWNEQNLHRLLILHSCRHSGKVTEKIDFFGGGHGIWLDTGHNRLNRHLALLSTMDDPVCPLCKEVGDTSLHIVGSCCAITNKQQELFRKHFLGPSDLRQVYRIGAIFSGLQKPAEGFGNLRVNMGIGPTGGLSTRR